MNNKIRNRNDYKSCFIHLFLEIFFAILPLFVLGVYWPSGEDHHPKEVYYGPEISMSACILYGLALVRFLQGLGKRGKGEEVTEMNEGGDGIEMGGRIAFITLFPLIGVISSVILISKTSSGSGNILMVVQIINLIVSAIAFVLIGGYGLRKS